MNHRHRRARNLLLLACAWVLSILVRPTASLHADQSPSAGYTLDWWTVDGGGQSGPAGQGYTLEGTIGQPDAAHWQGGSYELVGGFWVLGAAASPAQYHVYLPLVTR